MNCVIFEFNFTSSGVSGDKVEINIRKGLKNGYPDGDYNFFSEEANDLIGYFDLDLDRYYFMNDFYFKKMLEQISQENVQRLYKFTSGKERMLMIYEKFGVFPTTLKADWFFEYLKMGMNFEEKFITDVFDYLVDKVAIYHYKVSTKERNKIVRYLVKENLIDINKKSPRGRTLCWYNCKLFIELGGDITITDNDNNHCFNLRFIT